MSLLMDALKRAEKARQAEAAKEVDGNAEPDSRELSLDPLDDRAEPEPASPTEPPSPPRPSTPTPPTPAPSREESGELSFSLEDDSPPVAFPPPKIVGNTTEHLGPFSLMDDDSISTEDTGEMQTIAREAEEAVQDYFDESSSMAIALDDIQQVINEDTMAGTEPVTADELARQTAHTVFDAKIPPTRRRGRAAMVIVPVVLVLFLSVSGFVLWDDLVRAFVGPPPLVSRQPPPVVQVEPAPELVSPQIQAPTAEVAEPPPAATAQVAGPDTGSAASAAVTEPAMSSKLAAAAKAASAESGGAGPESMIKSALESAPVGTDKAAATKASPAAPKDDDSMKIAALTTEALAGPAGGGHLTAAPSLKISRKSTPDRIHPMLQSAYEALQQGANARARGLYEEVLTRDPRNRNALLGIGAIATRAGELDAARQIYARLLALYPRDPVARAALIDSYQDVSPAEGEGHIKRLLAQDSNQSFLYATLGNLYARQGRWPEAQRAYFDAYRLNSANADYAFNLAVSLDQIGQPAAALSYYRRALELAEGGPASFETQSVLKRISNLGSAGSG